VEGDQVGTLNDPNDRAIAIMGIVTAMTNGDHAGAARYIAEADLTEAHLLLMSATSLLTASMRMLAAEFGQPIDEFLQDAGLLFARAATT
jgi:hypothetical protein